MQKVVSASVIGALVVGTGYTLWGWWGVILLALLGLAVWLGYEFYKYASLDLPTAIRLTGVPMNATGPRSFAMKPFSELEEDKETAKRRAREKRLHHLETDIRHACDLMDFERRAHELRTAYAQRRTAYSRAVEQELNDIVDEIDSLKRSRRS